MTWTLTFVQDTDTPTIGTATAVWSDPANTTLTVVYAQRVNSQSQIPAFVANAKAKLVAQQTSFNQVANIVANANIALNS